MFPAVREHAMSSVSSSSLSSPSSSPLPSSAAASAAAAPRFQPTLYRQHVLDLRYPACIGQFHPFQAELMAVTSFTAGPFLSIFDISRPSSVDHTIPSLRYSYSLHGNAFPVRRPSAMTWTQDGSHLIVLDDADGIASLDASSLQLISASHVITGGASHMSFLNGNPHVVAFGSGDAVCFRDLRDLRTDAIRIATPGKICLSAVDVSPCGLIACGRRDGSCFLMDVRMPNSASFLASFALAGDQDYVLHTRFNPAVQTQLVCVSQSSCVACIHDVQAMLQAGATTAAAADPAFRSSARVVSEEDAFASVVSLDWNIAAVSSSHTGISGLDFLPDGSHVLVGTVGSLCAFSTSKLDPFELVARWDCSTRFPDGQSFPEGIISVSSAPGIDYPPRICFTTLNGLQVVEEGAPGIESFTRPYQLQIPAAFESYLPELANLERYHVSFGPLEMFPLRRGPSGPGSAAHCPGHPIEGGVSMSSASASASESEAMSDSVSSPTSRTNTTGDGSLSHSRSGAASRMSITLPPNVCSSAAGSASQVAFVCITCLASGLPALICESCVSRCHAGHDVENIGIRRNVLCDCGDSACFPHGPSCALLLNKRDSPAAESRNNHNYSSRFCICDRLVRWMTLTEDMIQCDGCEDWFHDSCAGFSELADVQTVDYVYLCGRCVSRYLDNITFYVDEVDPLLARCGHGGLFREDWILYCDPRALVRHIPADWLRDMCVRQSVSSFVDKFETQIVPTARQMIARDPWRQQELMAMLQVSALMATLIRQTREQATSDLSYVNNVLQNFVRL
eukprot:ANDGO_06143.mRNA.1 Protein mlo2